MAEELENKPVENNAQNNAQTEVTPEDVQNNKAFAILAYFWLLVLVPIFAAKESKFARFHANQGLVLCIVETAWWLINFIITAILIHTLSWSTLWLLSLWGVIYWLVSVGIFVFAIIGIVNAAQGSVKPLPIFGKYKILK
ncbi:MAG: zinc ribbon domain-containing protein [Bacteroidales bacterium]|nr:zinc ribbon domain-containing protein [Bacteroidales bacterium]